MSPPRSLPPSAARAPWRAVALCLTLATTGCQRPDDATIELGTGASNGGELAWERFKAGAERDATGAYVVEEDMSFHTEAALRRYWEEEVKRSSGKALTVNRRRANGVTVDDVWPATQKLDLTYCVANSFGSNQNTLLAALDEATESWSRVAAVSFRRVTTVGTCNASNNEVVFDVQRSTSGSYTAKAFFPEDKRSDRTLRIRDTAFTTKTDGADLSGILRHELGHVLGFRHEHIWDPSECTGETSADARAVTAYDQLSVMHYPQCRTPAGGGFRQSHLDYVGAVELYGLAPALVGVIDATL